MIYIDESLCVGCGVCVQACPTGAMRMVNGVAQVEQSLCRECEVCMQACPHGAVLSLMEPAGARVPASVSEPASIPVRPTVRPSQPAAGAESWLGAAVGFVEQEIAPRVASFLRERQQQSPAQAFHPRTAPLPGRASYGGRGGRRQGRRRRRGRR